MRWTTWLLLLAACGGPEAPLNTPVTAKTTSDASAPPAARACLPKSTASGALASADLTGEKASLCFSEAEDEEKATCLDVDLASGALSNLQEMKMHKAGERLTRRSESSFNVSAAKDSVKVCPNGAKADKECSTVKIQHKPVSAGHGQEQVDKVIAAVNDDGSRVFVFAPEVKGDAKLTTSWTGYGDLYDTKTGKRLFHQKLVSPAFTDPSNMWSATFLGKNLILGDYVCCGPGGTTYLFDPEKGALQRAHGYSGELDRLDGSIFWVLDGKKLSFVDVASMQPVGGAIAAPGGVDNPEKSVALFLHEGSRGLLAFASPPGYVVVDAKAKTGAAPVKLPLCP